MPCLDAVASPGYDKGPVPGERGNPEQRGDRHGDSDDLRMAGELEYHHRAERDYTLQSVATSGGLTGTSPGIAITVNNPPPASIVVAPSNNAALAGSQYLDALASSGVTTVQYEVTGGSLTNAVIATAAPTIYGWLASWNTTTVPNGTYALQAVASYAGGVSGASAPISISVTN